ncbi:TPA: acyltransferase family protein [Escherichia coli]
MKLNTRDEKQIIIERMDWIDTMKFLGILAIYIGHFYQASGKLYPFVFMYHVPLFFFISGFFSSLTDFKFNPHFLVKKFKRLMVPYFIFAFINLALIAVNKNYDTESILKSIYEIICGIRNTPAVGTIWFINCLFVIIVIDYITYTLIKNRTLVLIIALAVHFYTQLLMPHNPLSAPKWFMNIDSALAYWWLLASGRQFFPILKKSINTYNKLLPICIFIATGVFTAYALFNSQFINQYIINTYMPNLSKINIVNIINNDIGILIIILFNAFLAKRLSRINLLKNMGKNTLNICGFEMGTKLLISTAIMIPGLRLLLPTPLSAVLYSSICVIFAHHITTYLSAKFPSIFSIR